MTFCIIDPSLFFDMISKLEDMVAIISRPHNYTRVILQYCRRISFSTAKKYTD